MHALEGLQVYYNNSKDGDIYHTVVGIILQNIHKVKNCTIYDLAELCYVSPTTISRLSKKLGYRGLQDFKNNLINTIKNYEMLNRYVSFNAKAKYEDDLVAYLALMERQVSNLREDISVEKMDQIIDSIQNSKKVNFYTNGTVFSEYRFQGDLIMTGHMSEIKNSASEQLEDIKNLTEKDMVIMLAPIVSDAVDVNEIIRKIKERGAALFVLTDAYYPQFKKYADHIYCFEGDMGIIDDYRFAMYINLLSIRFREKVMV